MPDFQWPAAYIDPETGQPHGWDEPLPPDPNGYGGPSRYTYRDMVHDQAAARGMETDEWLERQAFERGEWEDDELSPPWVDDGDDGWGE